MIIYVREAHNGLVNRLVHGSFCYVLTINHLSLIIAAFGR